MVDVAKLAAATRGVEMLSLPTQASSDGICSPVAVIRTSDGRPRSLGARIPYGIIVDMDVLSRASGMIWLSGLGDLVSNLSAVRDWRLAATTQGEEIDDFACMTSEAAALSVVDHDADLADPVFQEKLIRGLILSGIAMEMAGSSRPASGGEHLISHAFDRMLAAPRLHGLQVALGTIAAYLLRGDPLGPLVAFYRAMGLPVVPADLGLTVDQMLDAIRAGSGTRPGRWTVLDQAGDADLDTLRSVYERGSVLD
jgi:glycerol-1-phosphate dehydrogenase [NAD(P)+]